MSDLLKTKTLVFNKNNILYLYKKDILIGMLFPYDQMELEFNIYESNENVIQLCKTNQDALVVYNVDEVEIADMDSGDLPNIIITPGKLLGGII